MVVAPRPASRTLGAVLTEVAARSPKAPAVIHPEMTLTYGELEAEARRVARGLLALGIARGDHVGLLMANSPEWVIAYFAAAKVGAVLVPFNTWYRQNEIAWTLRHCGVKVLIAAGTFLDHDYAADLFEILPGLSTAEPGGLEEPPIPDLTAVVFHNAPGRGFDWSRLVEAGRGITDIEVAKATARVKPCDVATILYTAGSTAEPKGVVLRHAGIVDNAFEIGARRRYGPEDRVWVGLPLFYGGGAIHALPAAFTHGAALVIQRRFDAGVAIDLIAQSGATAYHGSGNMTRAILEHPRFDRHLVSTLAKDPAGASEPNKRLALVELGLRLATPSYGLTECYGNATGGLPDDPLDVKLNTDGLPLPGFEVSIVDPETRRPMAGGEIGLILLRGHTTDQYFGNAAATAAAIDQDGWFDTGDLGRMDEAGRLIFHARLKAVIKSGGINVSPLEVEQLLCRHPQVRQAYVVGVPSLDRGELVIAFVEPTGILSEQELQEFVRASAAGFKVPRHIFFRGDEQLPRSPAGKVPLHLLREEAIRELGGQVGKS
jgi:fatty-acyl-CoA synthase